MAGKIYCGNCHMHTYFDCGDSRRFDYYLDSTRDRDASEVVKSKTSFDLPIKKDRSGQFMAGRNGNMLFAIPHDEIRRILEKYKSFLDYIE